MGDNDVNDWNDIYEEIDRCTLSAASSSVVHPRAQQGNVLSWEVKDYSKLLKVETGRDETISGLRDSMASLKAENLVLKRAFQLYGERCFKEGVDSVCKKLKTLTHLGSRTSDFLTILKQSEDESKESLARELCSVDASSTVLPPTTSLPTSNLQEHPEWTETQYSPTDIFHFGHHRAPF